MKAEWWGGPLDGLWVELPRGVMEVKMAVLPAAWHIPSVEDTSAVTPMMVVPVVEDQIRWDRRNPRL